MGLSEPAQAQPCLWRVGRPGADHWVKLEDQLPEVSRHELPGVGPLRTGRHLAGCEAMMLRHAV